MGDVVAIYDTNGARRVKYNYDAFGNCYVASSTTDYTLAFVNPIRYRGYYFDQESGWYFLNARYYSPEWRRFISPDDTSYLDPESVNGLNLYCYCGNDPVNYCDPSGHSLALTLTLIGLGIGVIGGLGYAAYTDYQDDNSINGSIGWQTYLGYSIIGGAIGAGIGFTIGYFGPAISSYIGGALSSMGGSPSLALAGGGTASVANAGILGTMLAAGALVLFASNHRPGNNQAQNKQFENAVRKAGYNPKDPAIRDELQKIHRYIRNKKLDLGWKELVELIKEWLG